MNRSKCRKSEESLVTIQIVEKVGCMKENKQCKEGLKKKRKLCC